MIAYSIDEDVLMAHDDLYKEPVFQSLDVEAGFDAPPVTKTAIAALLVGVASLVVLLAPKIVLVSFVAVGLGLAALWFSRQVPTGLSSWFATIGMALGAFTAVWSIVAVRNTQAYLYAQAAEQASHFLDVLGQGKLYEAAELTQTEPSRQITGTNLKAYYDSLGEEEGGPARSFMSDPFVLAIVEAGPDADWEYTRPIEFVRIKGVEDIVVEFRSRAKPDLAPVQIKMRRTVGLVTGEKQFSTALWNVVFVVDPNKNK